MRYRCVSTFQKSNFANEGIQLPILGVQKLRTVNKCSLYE